VVDYIPEEPLEEAPEVEEDLEHYNRECWPLQEVTRGKAMAKINGKYQATILRPSNVLAVAKFLQMNINSSKKAASIEQETNMSS